jgi:hypothetical protein
VALNKVMASGITLELPDRWQLCMASVREQGPLDGKPVTNRDPKLLGNCQPILVVRDGHVIFPNPDNMTELIAVMWWKSTTKQVDIFS